MEDTFLNIPLQRPDRKQATVNIIRYDKDPMGLPPYFIWKVYFPGIVIIVNQDLTIDPTEPLPEWHRSIVDKIREITQQNN